MKTNERAAAAVRVANNGKARLLVASKRTNDAPSWTNHRRAIDRWIRK